MEQTHSSASPHCPYLPAGLWRGMRWAMTTAAGMRRDRPRRAARQSWAAGLGAAQTPLTRVRACRACGMLKPALALFHRALAGQALWRVHVRVAPLMRCMSGRGPFSPLDFLVLLLRQAPTLMLAATLGLSLPSRTWMVALARVCVYFRAVVVLSLFALQAAGMGWGAVQLPAQASHSARQICGSSSSTDQHVTARPPLAQARSSTTSSERHTTALPQPASLLAALQIARVGRCRA